VGVGVWRFATGGINTSKVAVAQLLQRYSSKIVPPPTPNYGAIQSAPNLSSEITSNDQFYVVSKNLYADPVVDGTKWQLTVNGEVERPFTLNYNELMAMPLQAQSEALMCISNDVGGPYMSNALWEGIPLATFLQRAGVKTGATKVVFHADDDYTDSIHLSKALEPTTLLAVRMNGVTLPQEHGFPVRMLVPGIYGMKHCKWLTRIEIVNYDFLGYWQQRGWDDAAPVRLTSRIDTPMDGSTISVNRTAYIAGVAFSGNKGISEVDVSLDSGQTWQRAILMQPSSDLTWVIWEYAWRPTTGNNYIITVRAIDLEGNVQDPREAPPLPIGSSGYHSIGVLVA
ncbi:MAG TPA: molybdopterin-dependent oxidoreductase, partial [Ktedonobacteraceae bacterium]|nr:molybdopterin-dependent oxidoreductase [Ktedonobacteraceae bacterium]